MSALAPSSVRPPQSQSVLEAVLERVTYANEDTGYTIARVATERTGPDLLTVVGPLLGAQVGESLRLTGRWSSHPKYGKQFQVDSFTTVLPATIQGIRRYLGSGLIKGIGPMMAERMVAHFGVEVLTIIEEQPGRLVEVHGLGPKRTQRIADAWEEQKAIKEVMVFLSGHRGVDVAGGQDLQGIRRRFDFGGAQRALPAGLGGVGDRLQDRGHDRPSGRDPARQPGADQSRPAVHPLPSRRQRALLPPRTGPGPRGDEDPAGRPGS